MAFTNLPQGPLWKMCDVKMVVGLNIFISKSNIHGNYNIVIYINIIGSERKHFIAYLVLLLKRRTEKMVVDDVSVISDIFPLDWLLYFLLFYLKRLTLMPTGKTQSTTLHS